MKKNLVVTPLIFFIIIGCLSLPAFGFEAVPEIDEKQFHTAVEELVFLDDPEGFGFEKDKGDITFSKLYPIHLLNPAFAFGESSEMTIPNKIEWVSIIFQNKKAVNVLGGHQTTDGQFEVTQVGFAPELPGAILSLQEDEVLIYEFPTGAYYTYSKQSGKIRGVDEYSNFLLNDEPGVDTHVFQKILLERYKDFENSSDDSIGGIGGIADKPSNNKFLKYSLSTLLLISVIGTIVMVKRKKRFKFSS